MNLFVVVKPIKTCKPDTTSCSGGEERLPAKAWMARTVSSCDQIIMYLTLEAINQYYYYYLDGKNSLEDNGCTAGQHLVSAFCHHILEVLQRKLDLGTVLLL